MSFLHRECIQCDREASPIVIRSDDATYVDHASQSGQAWKLGALARTKKKLE